MIVVKNLQINLKYQNLVVHDSVCYRYFSGTAKAGNFNTALLFVLFNPPESLQKFANT